MNEVRRVIRSAAWRLLVLDLFRTLLVTASAAVTGLLVLRLVQQVFGLAFTHGQWWQYAGIAGSAAVLAAAAWSVVRRHSVPAVARELDERAELRESLSTALCVEKNEGAWARAVVETARDRATRVDVRRAIPFEAPRLWPVPFGVGLALAVVWWTFPRLDVLGNWERRQNAEDNQRQIQQVKAETKRVDEIEKLLNKHGVEVKEDQKADPENTDPSQKSAEQVKSQAIKKLTSLQDKLQELRQSDKAMEMEATRNALKQLKQPGAGPMDELSKALSQGNFAKAQEELGELSKKMADGSLSPEQKEQAKKQLEKLSEQLGKIAEQREELKKALEKAGLSGEQAEKAAKSPAALKQALEQMKNLSEEQKQQLQKAAQQQASASKNCEGMAQSMGEMAKGMSAAGMSKEGQEGAQSLSGQLSEMEMMSAEMDQMDAAMGECQGMLARLGQGMCNGNGDGEVMASEISNMWREGDSSRKGRGQGGPGKGMGGGGAAEEAPTTTEKAMAKTKMQAGPIVGSRLVYGDQVKGESVAEFSEAVEAASTMAAESVETMRVPREYQDAVKTYFGRLRAKVKATPAGGK
ncbi:MAG: hypothetical protein IT437_06250 [Phycisphaerales bacterium]|nr:hypothetical protein [Phycisphaerales bacterium]